MARMGEVIPSEGGDGVFKGRAPHTSMNQMNLKFEKLLTAAFAAALGASFVAANPGNAFSHQCRTDGIGGYRCSGNSGSLRIRDDGFGGYKIRNNETGSSCRARSDGFGGVRATCF